MKINGREIVNRMPIYSKLLWMKDMDQQQHLENQSKQKLSNKSYNLPESEIAETDALGGCCSRAREKRKT